MSMLARMALAGAAGARIGARRATPLARNAVQQQQVRRMGGHGHVEYTGMEKTIRHYLPEDHHIVLANIASWFVIYGIYKVTQIGKKPAEAEPAPAAAPAAGGEVPSLFDESFEEFIKVPGNDEKYAKSLEEWAKTA
mmetsp:Transcript_16342/g.52145  ORF Transcript_16342/g.52145 Transcript_16342/m.52145 type:complete len:137 (+) Transcript_16342:66-476(+)